MNEQNSITARLMSGVEMVPFSGCWLWVKATRRKGYGAIRVDGRTIATHRLSYELHVGQIPDGMQIMHSCDIPCCINPAHLSVGSNDQNVSDRDAKGRQARGERMNSAKLTNDQVLAIRADQRSQRKIAAAYGLQPRSVWLIKNRRTWAHI